MITLLAFIFDRNKEQPNPLLQYAFDRYAFFWKYIQMFVYIYLDVFFIMFFIGFIIELFTHSSNPGPMVHTNLI